MKYRLIALTLTLFSVTAMATTTLPAPRASTLPAPHTSTLPAPHTSTLPAPHTSEQPIDQIVATVNGQIITQSDVDTIYRRALKQIARSHHPAPSKSVIKSEILNQLIYKTIQLSLASQHGMEVTKKQVDNAINGIAKQNRVSLAQLKKKVKKDGFTYPGYRKEIKEQILVTMLQHQALSSKVKVTKTDIRQFLEKYKAQSKYATAYHVIDMRVPLPTEATETQKRNAKTQAMEIIKKLRNGASAYKIAGVQVTNMGWKTLTSLPDLFSSKLANAKIHSVAGPILAQNGYHILEVTGVKHPKRRMPSELQVKNMLLQRQLNKALGPWLTKLRKQSAVKILTPQ